MKKLEIYYCLDIFFLFLFIYLFFSLFILRGRGSVVEGQTKKERENPKQCPHPAHGQNMGLNPTVVRS